MIKFLKFLVFVVKMVPIGVYVGRYIQRTKMTYCSAELDHTIFGLEELQFCSKLSGMCTTDSKVPKI